MLPKLNVAKTEMLLKLKFHYNWNVIKTEMTLKVDVAKTEILLNWNVAKTEMLLKLKFLLKVTCH